jgi:hypothetical protein
MKFSLNHSDLNKQVKQMIQKVETTGKNTADLAAKTVNTITNKLEEETVRRMPVDEGFLEKSIDTKVEKGSGIHDTWGAVWIPSNSPAADYALYMHELEYLLGKRSRRKQKADASVIVGRKFLERAMSENQRAFSLYIIRKFREFIGD